MMTTLPAQLERAREQAQGLPKRKTNVKEIDAFRRALKGLFAEQRPLMAKLVADGGAKADAKSTIEQAVAHLAGYYGLALSLECEDSCEKGAEEVRTALEKQAEAVVLAAEGDRAAALYKQRAAWGAVDNIPIDTEGGDPSLIHRAALVVYDKATGRSKYDSDADTWLSFSFRCPMDSCKATGSYRLISKHPTHRFNCVSCGDAFLVFVAIALQAEHTKRLSSLCTRLLVIGADEKEHQISFEQLLHNHAALDVSEGDLLLFTYNAAGRLRRVKNYSRNQETSIDADGRCFVATAATGPNSPEVAALRRFRDEVLLARPSGRAFVWLYWRVGPTLAATVTRSPMVRRAARCFVCFAARLVEKA